MLTYSKIDQLKFKEFLEVKDEPGNIENILIKKANNYIKFLQKIPGIRMVAVGNSVSMNHANKESDIDLFIITSRNRLWIVRVLVTTIFTILGLRKTKKHHAGKFCLSFFSTIDGMDFSNFAVENDIYLYFWIVYLKPILNYDNTYENFIRANSSWANFDEYLDIIDANKSYTKYEGVSFGNRSKILDGIDFLLKMLLEKRALKKFEEIGKPYGIIIGKDMLKFHDDDKRVEVREKIFVREEE